MRCIAQQSGAGWLLHLEKTSNQVRKLVAALHKDFSLTPSGWWPPMGAASKAGPPFRFLTPNLKLRSKLQLIAR
jgi:hypothetical protein